MRIVLDTNVLVSALISPSGAPHELLERWEAGQFTLVTSAEQSDELRRVLAYPKLQLRIDSERAARLVSNLQHVAAMAENLPQVSASRDASDNVIIASAMAGQASYLVTGDKSDLLQLVAIGDVSMVSPRRMIEILDAPRA